jgi:uncharacterized membrane protein
MSDEERTVMPSEPPVPEHPVDALSEKLAATADEVTASLQDLLPEQPPAEPVATPPIEPVAEAPAQPSIASEVQSEAQAGQEAQVEEPAAPQAQAAQEAAQAELPPATSAFAQLKGDTSATMESTGDDRLMSLLAWLTMVVLQLPIVSVIQLLSANTRDRLFQRHHAVTSLLFYAASIVYEIVAGILYVILGTVTLGCGFACLWIIFLVPHALALYYGLQAYNGKLLELPVLTNFARQQGWL